MISKRHLKNGFEIPVLGLGTWLMGGDTAKQPSSQDETDVIAIQTAIDMGYTHIDTAEMYAAGYTEELLGRAVKDRKREDLFLASKASQGHHTTDQLATAIDGSLHRLGTDYLDLYCLHRPTLETPFAETARGLNDLYRQGKIRHVGVCNFSAAHLDELQKHLDMPIVANQVHYNLVFREPETSGLLQHAIEKDYFVMAWRPLKFKKRNASSPTVEANAWEKDTFPLLDAMAEKYGTSNVQIALNWVTYQPNTLTIVKSSREEHLKDAAQSFHWTLTEEDYRLLSEEFEPVFAVSDTIPLI